MLALLIIGLFSFVALSIDLGILVVSRTQCQNAADSAALVSTRNLDNKPTSVNNNQSNALTAAQNEIGNNVNLATNFTAANIQSIRYGMYDYDPVAQQFAVTYPGSLPAGRSWTATEVTVQTNQPMFFGNVINLSNGTGPVSLSTGARAVAVHRPRDLAVVMDLTGSMRFGSQTQANGAYLSADPIYPQMGHYQRYTTYLANNPNAGTNGAGAAAGRHNPFFTSTGFVAGSGELYAPSNDTVVTAGGPASVKDWMYVPDNLTNPTVTQTVIAPNMAAVAPATPLPRAFHHWDPAPGSAGDPDNYIAPTYDYSSWSYTNTGTTYILYPTPETFEDQSHVGYLGDRFARKKGAEQVAANRTAGWAPTLATGAAANLADYLGWINYTGGALTPSTTATGTVPATTGTVNTFAGIAPQAALGSTRDWTNFRDATWERYGYDLDVADYVANRPTDWDPRWDYDISASLWRHEGPAKNTNNNISTIKATWRPILRTGSSFQGYSMGPGYWGKTFFTWPPDPRSATTDWRRRFFLRADTTALTVTGDNNTGNAAGTTDSINEVLLTNGNGNTLLGGTINYAAVLQWLKTPPMALPPNLRAGRILYYSSIPNDVNTAVGSADEKTDKQFWKNYIDFVLRGTQITIAETNGWPEGSTPGIYQNNPTAPYDLDGAAVVYAADPTPYMHYLDNPSRPRAQFWFGPTSMMGFLAVGTSNAWAGTTHETQTWQLKAGMNSTLDDIRNNHPNDSVGMAYFSYGSYGYVSVALGQEWGMLKAALFYPQTMIDAPGNVFDPTKEFRAFNAAMSYQGSSNIPNAQGGTDPNTGLAMGYNILTAGPAPLRALPPSPWANQTATRRGRRGASKIVIFETDGVPNSYSTLALVAAGYNSYYNVSNATGGSPGNGAAAAINPALAVVDQIVAPMATITTGTSGLSTPSSPAKVYAIGFGDLFSTPSATFQPQARAFLLNVQQHGGTSAAADTGIPPAQIITGPYQGRIDSLRTCLERIFQSGVQVTLIE